MSKHIFVIGSSISGLGKGILSSSLGMIIKSCGYSVTIQKFDGYFNGCGGEKIVGGAGQNPELHGETFCLADGHESDMDLSNYQRFLDDLTLNKNNSLTAGIIYGNVLYNERKGLYQGQTIQVIPHITNEVLRYMHKFDDKDIVIHEIGGSLSDDEIRIFLHAIRQMQYHDPTNCLIILLVYLPYLRTTQEIKTKIAQQSVEQCRSLGLNPDILICRADRNFTNKIKEKLSKFTFIPKEYIIKNLNAKTIYHVPKMLVDEGILRALEHKLNIDLSDNDKLDMWNRHVLNTNYEKTIKIGLVGKYVSLHDSYVSIIESLRFAGWKHKVNVEIEWINSEELENDTSILNNCQGFIIAPGFGYRGFEGKIIACKYAREKKIPTLAICFGAQAMWIEFARNVLNIKDATSEEFVSNNITDINNDYTSVTSNNLIVHLMNNQKKLQEMQGTLRLGNYPCILDKNSISFQYYSQSNNDSSNKIELRHRHRYEFNNIYRKDFQEYGIKFTGLSPDGQLVEITELDNHPFYIGCQGHPEMDTTVMNVNPLFDALIDHILLT